MKHHLVTLACTAAAAAAALAAGLLLGPSPRRLQPLAEQPLAPLASAPPRALAKADRLPIEPRRSGVALGPPTLPVDAVLVPTAAWVAARPDLAPAPPVASTEAMPAPPPPGARHRHTICDRYGMHKVWYGRRWRCRR